MPAPDNLGEITRALSAPLGDLIAAVGRGVAEAQQALDLATLETFKAVYNIEGAYAELRQLGYQPTWYRIPEVSAEMHVSLTVSGEERLRVGGPSTAPSEEGVPEQARGRIQLYVTPVDASYSNTYNYSLTATSVLRFRIVPVPPLPQAEGLKVVPNVVGRKFGEARATLDQLGVPYSLAEAGYQPKGDEGVERIEPQPGGLLTSGQRIVLSLKPASPMMPAPTQPTGAVDDGK